MKNFLNHPWSIYLVAGIACLCIMIIIDYLLGAEAEHLNAWVIVNRLAGHEIGIPDSLAIRKFGLYGAAAAMVAVNMLFGSVLIFLLKGFIKLVHS